MEDDFEFQVLLEVLQIHFILQSQIFAYLLLWLFFHILKFVHVW